MSTWKTLPQDKPADGEEVWIRLNYWFGAPFLAKWDLSNQQFFASPGYELIYPLWTISRWRSQ